MGVGVGVVWDRNVGVGCMGVPCFWWCGEGVVLRIVQQSCVALRDAVLRMMQQKMCVQWEVSIVETRRATSRVLGVFCVNFVT